MAEWEEFSYTAFDGLRLAGRKYGWQHRDRLAVVCLAGLTRNSADFHELAVYLSTAVKTPRRVLTLDYRGRGASEFDKNWENYNVLTEADDVIQGMTAAGVAHAAIIGTSRGGLIAMVLSALRPGVMKAVVLNDIGPEVEASALLRIKNYVQRSRDPNDWQDAAAMLREAAAAQFPKWDDAKWDEQARLIFAEKDGRIIRRYDPDLGRTMQAIDLDRPMPSLWPQFAGLKNIPLLVIRGKNSDLLSAETAKKMQAMHPDMRLVEIADQGHVPDLGSAGLPRKIASFIERVA